MLSALYYSQDSRAYSMPVHSVVLLQLNAEAFFRVRYCAAFCI